MLKRSDWCESRSSLGTFLRNRDFDTQHLDVADYPAYDISSSVFLFESSPYVRGKGSELEVVQHLVVAAVLQDYENVDLEPLDPSEYLIVPHFWKTHPREIQTFNCYDKYRRHSEPENISGHCYNCDGVTVGFDSNRLLKCLYDSCAWPFPTQTVLAQRTSVTPIDMTCLGDLHSHLKTIQDCAQNAKALLHDLDVEGQYADARIDAECLYQKRVSAIDERALVARASYDQLKTVGLDEETLALHEQTILARITSLENGEALARLRAEAAVIYAKIAALQIEATAADDAKSDLEHLADFMGTFYREPTHSQSSIRDISIPIKRFLEFKKIAIVKPVCLKSNAGRHYVPYCQYALIMWDISVTGEGSNSGEACNNAWAQFLTRLIAKLASGKT